METEDDENSKLCNPSFEPVNDSTVITTPTTDGNAPQELPNTDPPREPETLGESQEPQVGGGDSKLQSPHLTEAMVPDMRQDQDVVTAGDLIVAELSEMEKNKGGGESQSPSFLLPQQALSQRGENMLTVAIEESKVIEPPQSSEEVSGKEEEQGDLIGGDQNDDIIIDDSNKVEDGDLIAGEQSHGVINNIDSPQKDNDGNLNAEVEDWAMNKEIETEREIVADVAEVTGTAEGVKTDSIQKMVIVDAVENVEKSDLAEDLKNEAADWSEETGTADEDETIKKMDVAEETEEVADLSKKPEMVDITVEADTRKEVEEELKKTEFTDLSELTEAAERPEITDFEEKTEATEEAKEIVNKAGEGEVNKVEMDMAGIGKNEEMELPDVGEDFEMAEEAENVNEAEDMEVAVETEVAEDELEEVSRIAYGKRKRGKNGKAPTRVPPRKKLEEDVCFICFDGGDLVLCDRRGCPKAYHPACVNRDEAFFRAKGKWNCGWHLCSNCEKNAYYMCYTCTFSLCKGCIKDAVILCVRGNKGFCETCMKTVLLIERNEQAQVDFNDKGSWEYLFKDYYIDLKQRLSLTSEELAQAKNPWKGPGLSAEKQELPDELYDPRNDGGSGSETFSGNAEVNTSKRRKAKKRLKLHTKERDSPSTATVNGVERASTEESAEWASKELLEFVMHMRNGDKSVCSQFDVQALLLEYIKRNKLRDPRRKSQIICDSRLENLFGKPRVGHFEMLKLLESHFLLKEDSQADDFQGSVVDTEANQLEAEGNSDAFTKSTKDRRKSRKKGDRRGLQSNVDDYAAIDMHNINLIYLRRSLVEELIEDNETFHDKVVGSFVRIRISGNAQKQDLYRLVQVVGTSKAAEPYRVGKKISGFELEILNLNKTEVVSIDILSNQEFTEDECKRLRQSIKCGLINRLTVGDIQEKAMAFQAIRVKDSLETEITRLSHLRDRASDLGRRKQLRECVEKLQLLKSPDERQRRLEEIPEIHVDPNMDPSYESEEDEGETDDKKQENYLRPRSSSLSRRGREPISPRKEGFASNESWGGTRNYSSMNWELSRNLSNKSFTNIGDDAVGASDKVNENLRSQGREKEKQQSQSWEKQRAASNSETQSTHSVVIPESAPRGMPEISAAPSPTGLSQSAAKVNETEKTWHYQDPSGKIQGSFSMVQLRKWNNTGYFPADLRIWRTTETQDDAKLLTDVLSGNFEKNPPLVVNSSLKSQLVPSPHLSSTYSVNAGESWKSQPEISDSTGHTAHAPLDIPKHATDRWGSETNLPSPTPVQTATGGTKGQVYETKWSPTPAQPAGSLSGSNSLAGGNGEPQHPALVIPESGQSSHTSTPLLSSATTSGGVNGTNFSHGVNPVPKTETVMPLSSLSAPHMHAQSVGESSRLQTNSHLLPAPDSINGVIDLQSLHNLVQPASNNPLVGTHSWGAGPVPKPEINTLHPVTGSGSQAWVSAPLQKLESTNPVSMPTQPSGYGNWGNAPISGHTAASSFTTGNPTVASSLPGTSGFMPSDPWRAPIPGPPNIQPNTSSNMPWGMGITDNQSATPRQGQENQNAGWGPIPGNPNMSWGGSLPANSNQGWVAPGNVNPGWVAPVQGQAPVNSNPGWAASVPGQAPGNAFPSWVPPGQGPVPVNANPSWVRPGQGPPPGNANPNLGAPTGNMGAWRGEKNQSGSRYSSQRDRGSQGGDGGGKQWNRQSSFGRGGESSNPSLRGQRVCVYHENGHCKKGASCDYLHN